LKEVMASVLAIASLRFARRGPGNQRILGGRRECAAGLRCNLLKEVE
jgi:hypothetical protein